MYPFFPTRLEMENKKNRENKWNTTILTQHEAIHYPCQLKLSERCLSSRNRCAMPRPIIWHDSKHSLFMQMIISNIVSTFFKALKWKFLALGFTSISYSEKTTTKNRLPTIFQFWELLLSLLRHLWVIYCKYWEWDKDGSPSVQFLPFSPFPFLNFSNERRIHGTLLVDAMLSDLVFTAPTSCMPASALYATQNRNYFTSTFSKLLVFNSATITLGRDLISECSNWIKIMAFKLKSTGLNQMWGENSPECLRPRMDPGHLSWGEASPQQRLGSCEVPSNATVPWFQPLSKMACLSLLLTKQYQ